MCDLANGLKVRDVVSGVSNAFEVNSLGLVINEGLEVLGIVAIDKLGGHAEPWEEDLQLVVGAAVKVRSGNDVVSGVGKACNGHELRRLAGRSCYGCDATLERCNSLLQYIHGRLHRRGTSQAASPPIVLAV